MRPRIFDVDPADANPTGFASNVTGASFTLTANDSGDNLAHQVSIKNDSGTNHAGKTITLVGTDANGIPITEAVTGPGPAATVESSYYFLTLTSATPSATIGADTFDIGWVDEVVTATVPLNWRGDVPATYAISGSSGVFVAIIEESFQDIRDGTANSDISFAPHWIAELSTPAPQATADVATEGLHNATAGRIRLESYSSGAELQFMVSQRAFP
jgi:hypothetical protein